MVSSLTWLLLLSFQNLTYKHTLFGLALILGMIEKLSRITNILSMERDWVPAIANPCRDATNSTIYSLTHLNTVMRRIDMLCKLIAPLAISSLMTAVKREELAILAVATTSILSWGLESWCVRQVWNQNRRLRVPKDIDDRSSIDHDSTNPSQPEFIRNAEHRSSINMPKYLLKISIYVKRSMSAHYGGLQYYFSTAVWIPSFCAAIPHASVLTFSGTLITYLLNTGLSLNMVTVARVTGALFEIGSTFIYPWAVRVLSGTRRTVESHAMGEYSKVETQDVSSSRTSGDDGTEVRHLSLQNTLLTPELGVVRTGLWGIYGLFLSLVSTQRLESIRIIN